MKEALNDMPPRDESELDQVTLHNMGTTSAISFRSLRSKFRRLRNIIGFIYEYYKRPLGKTILFRAGKKFKDYLQQIIDSSAYGNGGKAIGGFPKAELPASPATFATGDLR